MLPSLHGGEITALQLVTVNCMQQEEYTRSQNTQGGNCSPLITSWMQAYELRGAGAVLHSHSLNAVLATLIDENSPDFKVTHLEMIKVCFCLHDLQQSSGLLMSRQPMLSVTTLQALCCRTGHCGSRVLWQLHRSHHREYSKRVRADRYPALANSLFV